MNRRKPGHGDLVIADALGLDVVEVAGEEYDWAYNYEGAICPLPRFEEDILMRILACWCFGWLQSFSVATGDAIESTAAMVMRYHPKRSFDWPHPSEIEVASRKALEALVANRVPSLTSPYVTQAVPTMKPGWATWTGGNTGSVAGYTP